VDFGARFIKASAATDIGKYPDHKCAQGNDDDDPFKPVFRVA
jgi:hypothetical protein